MSDLRSSLVCGQRRAIVVFVGLVAVSVCIERSAVFGQEPFRPTPEQAVQYRKFEALQQEALQLKKQGDWQGAVAKVREAIPVVEGVLGPINAQSYYAWEFIASLYEDQGAFGRAVEPRQQCLALAKKLYQKKPWLIADAQLKVTFDGRLSQLTAEQWKQFSEAGRLANEMMKHWVEKDFPAAFEAGQQAHAIRTQLFGDDDYFSSRDLFMLGRIRLDQRDFPAAQKRFEELLQHELKQCGKLHARTAVAYGWIGRALFDQGDYRGGLEKRLKALEISRQVRAADDPELSDDIAAAARNYLELRENDKALQLFEEVLALSEQSGEAQSIDYANTLVNIATTKYYDGRVKEAHADFERATKLYEALPAETEGRDIQYAGALNNFARVCAASADLVRERALLKQAQAICETSNAPEASDFLPAVLNQLGTLEADVGNWSAAFEAKEQALALARKRWGDDHPTSLTILHEFGLLLRDAGYPAQARTNLELAFRGYVRTLGDKHESVAKVISDLSQLYLTLGDRAKAVEFGEKAVLAARQATGDDSELTANAYRRAAALLDPQKDLDAAEDWMKKSLDLSRRLYGPDSAQVASVLGELASIEAAAGRLDEAVAAQTAAIALRRKTDPPKSLALFWPLYNLAELQQRRGETKLAHDLFSEAASIAVEKLPEAHPDVATCLNGLAVSEARLGNYKTSWRLLQRATQLRDRMFALELPSLSAGQMTDFVAALDDATNLMLSLPADAAPAEEVATCVLMTKARVLNALSQLKAAEGGMADDPQLQEFAAALRCARERVSRLTISPPRSWKADELKEQLDDAQRELSFAEKNANIVLSARLGETLTASVENVRAKLPKDAALVEIATYTPIELSTSDKHLDVQPARYAAFVIHADAKRPVQRIDLGEAAAIDGGVANVVAQIQAARAWYRSGAKLKDEKALEEEYVEPAKQLSALLFAPLVVALGDAKLVYIAPDGELSGLPFEALVDGDGKYLIESGYRFAYLVSGRDLLAPTAPPGRGTAIFAAPNYNLGSAERGKLAPQPSGRAAALPASAERSPDTRGMSWEAHPGFLVEGQSAAASFNRGDFAPVASYTGDKALEESFKQLGNVRALVLVTHGYFLEKQKVDLAAALDVPSAPERGLAAAQGLGRLRRADNPLLRSGVILAGANRAGDERQDRPAGPEELSAAATSAVEDGWLTANEIAGLNLRGVQLAVLSACNSGREATGYGDSIAGLRTAFLSAGVQSFVGSLFEVPDKETAEMMKPFYDAVAAGQSPLEALTAAEKLTIERRRKQHGAAHPFFWASFVLAGRP